MAFELTGQIEKHLVNDQIVWLTTVTPTGRPAPRPVWFIWDGTTVTIYSMPSGAKLKHIAVNDQVSLHFNSTPGGGDVVVISGRAEVVGYKDIPQDAVGIVEWWQFNFRPSLSAFRLLDQFFVAKNAPA